MTPPNGRSRLRTLLLISALLPIFYGCTRGGGWERQSRDELIVFAASSLTDVFDDLGEAFVAENPGVTFLPNYAGSSQLAVQLMEGSEADLFASANMEQIERVVAAGQAAGPPVIFATNQLAIIVPADNPARIDKFSDLARPGVDLLLAAFGRRGLLGQPLGELGIRLPFTVGAVVIAQVFVSAPFFIRAAQARFAGLPRELEEAAMIDGAESWNLFRHITLPLSARALTGGLLLSWARALGEFGATILFAGNLAGRTQTMPLLVYGALEQDLSAAFTTALILLALAGLSIGLLRYLARLDETDRDALADQW